MRVIAAVLVFLGSACALAQDPAPAGKSARPDVRLVPWSFEAAPRAAAHPQNVEAVEIVAQRSPVCSVRLLEMPIPQDTKFTMRVLPAPETGDRINAKVPAPACPRD
ncbi:MAG: hypothetical protein ABSH47_01790 [Bryobacteraceae bacterium]|jgi:hypothetical protein